MYERAACHVTTPALRRRGSDLGWAAAASGAENAAASRVAYVEEDPW